MNIIYNYKVITFEGEEKYLDYEKGMILARALLTSPPQYIYIDGDIVKTSNIKELRREKVMVPTTDHKFETQQTRELTPGEQKAKERLESITSNKLLSDGN